MNEQNSFTPLELEKLCANIVIKNLWNNDEYTFKNNLIKLNLPDTIKNNIFERYLVIKHILNNSNN